MRVTALFVENMTGPALQMVGAKWVSLYYLNGTLKTNASDFIAGTTLNQSSFLHH